jgi:hypothetical protein
MTMRASLAATAAALAFAAPALAVDVGHVDEFASAGNLESWGGGAFYSNPGTGGVGGANDGYLRVETPFEAQLAARSQSSVYVGDWIAAGATGLSFYLRDEGGTGDLEIHVGIGVGFSNFWQSNVGFHPTDEWTQFTVDFSDPSQWTQIIGAGSFEEALMSTDRVLFRHDLAPFTHLPDFIFGSFGLDRVAILPAPGAGALLGLSALAAARRRR